MWFVTRRGSLLGDDLVERDDVDTVVVHDGVARTESDAHHSLALGVALSKVLPAPRRPWATLGVDDFGAVLTTLHRRSFLSSLRGTNSLLQRAL